MSQLKLDLRGILIRIKFYDEYPDITWDPPPGFSQERNFFAKTYMSHEDNCRCNLFPLHVPETCSLECASLEGNKQILISWSLHWEVNLIPFTPQNLYDITQQWIRFEKGKCFFKTL